jgi:hypothetical protein
MTRKRKKKSANTPWRFSAWALALAVALTSLGFPHSHLGLALELTAAVIFAIGTVWPSAFRRLYLVLVSPVGRLVKRAWFF